MADKTTIPGYIDNDYNEADQVIENLQRNELTPREIADFIGRELAKNKKKGEIAAELGKSNAFISQHVTLLDLPEPIAEVFNTGRSRDVTVINEMVTAYKKQADEVELWLSDDSQEITRGSVKLLREYLNDKRKNKSVVDATNEIDLSDDTGGNSSGDQDAATTEKKHKETDPDKLKKAIVQVHHDGRLARLILNKRPKAEGFAWMKYEDDGQEFEAALSKASLVALLEG